MTRHFNRPPLIGFVAAASMALGANVANAATATTTFTASANIVAACTVAATNLAFGNYNPSGAAALTGSSTVNVYCTSGTTYTIALSVGSASGSTFTTRHMANGGSLLNYNLYTTSGLTTVWGDASTGTATVSGAGAGLLTPSPNTVWGSVPISQDLPPGNYTSTITVTVTY